MIDREEGPMSLCHQCELLGVARSSLYYTPSKASNKDLQLMEALDVNRKKKYSDFGKMKCSKFGNKSAVFSGTILQ